MAEVENIVLEHLRAIRGDMAKMADRMSTMSAEMTAMRQLLASVITLQEHDHGDIAAMKVRLDRIERRLELVDWRSSSSAGAVSPEHDDHRTEERCSKSETSPSRSRTSASSTG